jgi:hypothetical protein
VFGSSRNTASGPSESIQSDRTLPQENDTKDKCGWRKSQEPQTAVKKQCVWRKCTPRRSTTCGEQEVFVFPSAKEVDIYD